MCFSAEASFGAGALLLGMGAVSLMKVRAPSQLPFAGIPIIFSIQQIAEGFVWMSLMNEDFAHVRQFMAYAFQFFAQVLWPAWIPFGVLLFEPAGKRRKYIKLFAGLGFIIAAYLAYLLWRDEMGVMINGHHLSYPREHPDQFTPFTGVLYLIATVVPCFISRTRWMWMIGAILFLSYLVTFFFYKESIISVWCFFASMISAVVVFIMVNSSEQNRVLLTPRRR